MKRISTILAIGFGCVAIAAAQTTTPQTSSTPQTTAKASSDSSITLTGCLQKGDQSGAVGTTGTAGAPSRTQSEAGNSAQFILTNAKSASSAESSRPAGAPPTSSATAGTTGARYILEPGSAQSDLTTNVGKRVEVTGTLDTSMSSSSPSPAAGAPSSASAAASPKLKVSSVRVIGSDCASDK